FQRAHRRIVVVRAEEVVRLGGHHQFDGRLFALVVVLVEQGGHFVEVLFVGHRHCRLFLSASSRILRRWSGGSRPCRRNLPSSHPSSRPPQSPAASRPRRRR